MLRIGLAYMDVPNLGDIAIYDTARYLIESILKENQVTDYEFVPVDIGDYRYKSRLKKKNTLNRLQKMQRKIRKSSVTLLDPLEAENAVREEWYRSDSYKAFSQTEIPKLKGLDMIIFCGGGLIKFHKQMFHLFLDEITRIAEQNGIPVLINAVGIEGYDWEDPRCRVLQKAMNRDCVKYISTRDHIQMLREDYMTNPNTVVKEVSDPAVWSQEHYGITAAGKTGKIGLGVIRPKIFLDYMYYVNSQRLKDMYYALAKKILDDGYCVEFFCNGHKDDYKFIEDILNTYPSLRKNTCVTMTHPQTARELVQTISGYERLLAVRLHASIIATALDIPNVNLVWNIKQILFGKQIGHEQNYLTKDQFDEDIVYERLMNAPKPALDATYKQSVRLELERAMMCVIKELDHD